MNYLQKKADKHSVFHEFSGKRHFFKVDSPSGECYNVSIEVGCDCTYMGVQGIPRGEICSHVLAVFKDIIKHGNIKLTVGRSDQMVQLRRNACSELVRMSNRSINEIRYSTGESKAHRNKKEEICKRLLLTGKQFMTEAIFKNGRGRADILILDDFIAIEIVNTESNESIKRKLRTYPEGIKIEVVRCGFLNEELNTP